MNRANQGSNEEKKDEWDDDGDPIDAVKTLNFENVASISRCKAPLLPKIHS